MWFSNGNITETVSDIGFRMKGGVSRSFVKKNWKISFNAFEKGRKWYKMKKLLLRGDELDPSLGRDFLSLSVSRSMVCRVQICCLPMLVPVDDLNMLLGL
jgi:hypothetical protein